MKYYRMRIAKLSSLKLRKFFAAYSVKNAGYDFSALMWPVPYPIWCNALTPSDSRTTQRGVRPQPETLLLVNSLGEPNCCRAYVVVIYQPRVMMECRFAPRQRMIRPPRPVGQNQCPEDNSQGQLDCRPSGTTSTTYTLYTQVVLCPCTWEFAKRGELSGNKSLGPKKGNEVICWNVQFVCNKTICLRYFSSEFLPLVKPFGGPLSFIGV